MQHRLLLAVICGLLLAVSGAALGQEVLFDLEATLARVGAQLERRYQRSQRVVSTEMVWVIDERLVARLEYVPLEEGLAEVTWDEDCVSIHSHGLSRGEAWVDVESGDVLRLDEHLTGQFDFREPADRPLARRGWITLERDDRSIRYQRVTFENPAETLLLPRSIERSWMITGSGFLPRYYRTQQFSNHRRFVADGRLVETPGITGEPGDGQLKPAPPQPEP